MKRKVLALAGVALVVVAAVGIAWALWMASSVIHTSIEVSPLGQTVIESSITDDDGKVDIVGWDAGDTGRDPATAGPLAARYDKDIGACLASINTPPDNEANLAIEDSYGGYFCSAFYGIRNVSPDKDWHLTEVAVNGGTFKNCPTLTSVDLDADTSLDVEGCVSSFTVPGQAAEEPILGRVWPPNVTAYAKVSLHILDSATPGTTHAFDVSFNAPAQTGGP